MLAGGRTGVNEPLGLGTPCISGYDLKSLNERFLAILRN